MSVIAVASDTLLYYWIWVNGCFNEMQGNFFFFFTVMVVSVFLSLM